FSTLYRFSSDGYSVYQDTMMFGRFIDGVVPFALVFVLIMLFTHSISVNKILGAAVVLGIIYTAFIFTAVPVILECGSTRIAPVLGMYPLRIGAASRELLNFDSLFLTMSMTFCVMGILLVVISCTKKYRSIIISTLMTAITVYSLIFISAVYLPICQKESVDKNLSVVELSNSVYDQAGAPAVTAYNISRHDALMLQFLNRNISVKVTYDIESVPENSFLVVRKSEDVSALERSRTPFLLVSESGDLRLYAYGERASAYLVSQDIREEELESEKETLMPEKTTAVTEKTTPPETTTVPSPATTTTERTPVITTYTVPSVITLPADSLDEEDEWAEID
ncbi:MAG: magnesium transporter, partial [Ruminiclostridium sp.]|nr:magnesium transporter [Ruminiclostridium sp.]